MHAGINRSESVRSSVGPANGGSNARRGYQTGAGGTDSDTRSVTSRGQGGSHSRVGGGRPPQGLSLASSSGPTILRNGSVNGNHRHAGSIPTTGSGSIATRSVDGGNGTGSGQSSRLQQQEVWSTEMKELDEAYEASLLDPSMAGSVYMRLLVKALGELQYEEDAERLLLES